MVYQFRKGSRIGGNPQVVGEVLQDIRDRRGVLVAGDVVEESKPDEAPLHRYFEWDDPTAALEYRKEQARSLIRAVVVTQTDTTGEIQQPVRAFFNVQTEEEKTYEPVMVVLSDNVLRERLFKSIAADLAGIREKMQGVSDLAEIVGAIEQIEVKVREKIAS